MLKALYLTLFHGFLCIGEATSKISTSPIQYKDLTLTPSEAVVILHHINIPRNLIRLSFQLEEKRNHAQCGHFSSFAYLGLGLLFATPGGRPYKCGAAHYDSRSVLSFCDLDKATYKSYSFRIGAASGTAPRGFSDVQIQLMGRWRSDAFRQYIRLPY